MGGWGGICVCVCLTVCVCMRTYALTKKKNRVPSDNEGNAQRGQQMIPKQQTWDFPGSPLAEMPRSQCEGVQTPPLGRGTGTKIPRNVRCSHEIKNKFKNNIHKMACRVDNDHYY